MILESLVRYYETLVISGKVSPFGWFDAKVSYVVHIDKNGSFQDVVDIRTEMDRGKKKVLVPRMMQVPVGPRRSSITAYFLWDNAKYALGQSENPAYFDSFSKLHHRLLNGVSNEYAEAFLRFLDTWDCRDLDLDTTLNVVFCCDGVYLQDVSVLRDAWQRSFDSDTDGLPKMPCLVTGRVEPAMLVHPSIKGVPGAQSSGASLVSFNFPAACSYGKEQCLNAPMSKYAAYAYTTALNYLLADKSHVYNFCGTTVVMWSETGNASYQDFWMDMFGGFATEQDLHGLMRSLCSGKHVRYGSVDLDPSMKIYVLGLVPNVGRLYVRFFLQNDFLSLVRGILNHDDRMEIVRSKGDMVDHLSFYQMMGSIARGGSAENLSDVSMFGSVLQAILLDTRYPDSLISRVIGRCKTDKRVLRKQAAVIKAYFLKNKHFLVPEEVLSVGLNVGSDNVPYVLGRLFSVYEDIQKSAVPGVQRTILDSYFSTACSNPARVFPILGKLSQSHLRKLSREHPDWYVSKNKLLTDLLGRLGDSFPVCLRLAEQGSFLLGYYHQTQYRYLAKEEKANVDEQV